MEIQKYRNQSNFTMHMKFGWLLLTILQVIDLFLSAIVVIVISLWTLMYISWSDSLPYSPIRAGSYTFMIL